MSNPNRKIDKTFLSLDNAEERLLIHRDYIAHCLRWSHVVRHMQKLRDGAVVLDIGCGKEMPLAKMLYVNKMSPTLYVGVDVNPLTLPPMLADKKIPVRLWEETDFCNLEQADVSTFAQTDDAPLQAPDVVTCFEVLEHVTPGHARRMVEHVRKLMSDSGTFFCSTPCFNGSAAGNHINEMTYRAFGKMLCDAGFYVRGHWGTFASIRDYEGQVVADDFQSHFDRLKSYYDSNLMAVMFAPLYPQFSRNVLWELRKKVPDDGSVQTVPFIEPQTWADVTEPWSQHPDYREMSLVDGRSNHKV